MSEPDPNDADLKALFARQRNAEHERAVGFHALRTRALATLPHQATTSAAPQRWFLPIAAAAVIVLAAVFTVSHRAAKAPGRSPEATMREMAEIDAAIRKSLAARHDLTAWQSPTDFLLQSIH
jgi:hypothetical protein